MDSYLFIVTTIFFSTLIRGLSGSDYITPNYTASYLQFIEDHGAFLYSNNRTFKAAIYSPGNQKTDFYLCVLHVASNTIIWCANHDAPISSSGRMILSSDGLIMSDEAAKQKWSTPQLLSPVSALTLTEVGTIVLLDQNNVSLWDSSDSPSDTIVTGQDSPVEHDQLGYINGSNVQGKTFALIALVIFSTTGLFVAVTLGCLCWKKWRKNGVLLENSDHMSLPSSGETEADYEELRPTNDDNDCEISSSVACALALMKDRVSPASESDENTTLEHASSEPSRDSDVIHPAPSMPYVESIFSSIDRLNPLDSSVSDGQHPEVTLGMGKYPIKGKYSVVIMHGSEFHALRNHCCPSELDYIASLSRCKVWDDKGGKRMPFFAKTLDDRLIIKEMKKAELESFMKFAPNYFYHVKESSNSGYPTCLAKILGIYQVTRRHAKSGKETKHVFMVQENVSFGRNINCQYELKGALYARFTAAADGSGDVLLDQNFVNDMNSSPLYIGLEDKRLLQRAIWNDTTFLSSINVMDYSLFVGVDGQRRELVCGITDYLSQYTWNKVLETWLKASFLVPKNVLPTIISPKEYKKRFRKFIGTHFLTIPQDWSSQDPLAWTVAIPNN